MKTVKPGNLVRFTAKLPLQEPYGLILERYRPSDYVSTGWYVLHDGKKVVWYENEFDVIQE